MNSYEDESAKESRQRTTDVSSNTRKFPLTSYYASSLCPSIKEICCCILRMQVNSCLLPFNSLAKHFFFQDKYSLVKFNNTEKGHIMV
jgi:hypothetical protein